MFGRNPRFVFKHNQMTLHLKTGLVFVVCLLLLLSPQPDARVCVSKIYAGVSHVGATG